MESRSKTKLYTIDAIAFTKPEVYKIKRVVVWKDYEKREKGVACLLKHGQKVRIKSYKQPAVEIETRFKRKRGWVHYSFIKELKA